MRVWVRNGPPAYMAVAAYLGLARPRARSADIVSGEDLKTLLQAFPGAVMAPPASPP